MASNAMRVYKAALSCRTRGVVSRTYSSVARQFRLASCLSTRSLDVNLLPCGCIARFSQSRLFSTDKYPQHYEVLLPSLSPTMSEGNIIAWSKKEGDQLKEGDVLVQIETDKATMDYETPEVGFLAKVLVPDGTKGLPIKTPIAVIVFKQQDVAVFKDFTPKERPSSTSVAPPSPPPPPEPKVPNSPRFPSQEYQPSPLINRLTPQPAAAAAPGPPPLLARTFASPLARRLALEKGVDLQKVHPSGPLGRVMASDVDKAVVRPAPASSLQAELPRPVTMTTSQPGAFTDIELTSMRKTIAKRLVESKQTVPHYYLNIDVKMDKLIVLQGELNRMGEGKFKLSINDFVVKASALALLKVPECNSAWMTDSIRRYNTVDISVAVSTDAGLITPVVFNAHQKGVGTINSEVKMLAEKARSKKLLPQEYQGGTFTISNLGMFGIKSFAAVINPPQSCILAVGSVEKRLLPSESNEKGFETASFMSVTLSCDHRVVDGVVGATWLKHFKDYMENPITMLL